MTALVRLTFLFALVPVCFTILGAALGVFWPTVRRLRSHVLHLAAGVVFAVVAGELLPEIQRRALVGDVVLGFAIGISTMLLVDWALDRLRRSGKSGTGLQGKVATSLLVAVGIDFLLDGLLLGVGFAAGTRIGILFAVAEAAEQLSVGLALASEMTRAGVARARVLIVVSGLGSLVFVSAGLGATALSGLSGGRMEIVLSFGLAALLYLVTEELLREAHEEPETTMGTAMFFVGFLAFLVIGMLMK